MVEFATENPMEERDLLDEESRAKLPRLYANEVIGLEAKAVVKFYAAESDWTWYASEYDGRDLFFGLVVGQEIELGYFSLSELAALNDALGLTVERDKHFEGMKLSELIQLYENERK